MSQKEKSEQIMIKFSVLPNTLEELVLRFVTKHPLEKRQDLVMRAIKAYYLCLALCYKEPFENEEEVQKWLKHTLDALMSQYNQVRQLVMELEGCRASELDACKANILAMATFSSVLNNSTVSKSPFIREEIEEGDLGTEQSNLVEVPPNNGAKENNTNWEGDSEEDDEFVPVLTIPDFGN